MTLEKARTVADDVHLGRRYRFPWTRRVALRVLDSYTKENPDYPDRRLDMNRARDLWETL